MEEWGEGGEGGEGVINERERRVWVLQTASKFASCKFDTHLLILVFLALLRFLLFGVYRIGGGRANTHREIIWLGM